MINKILFWFMFCVIFLLSFKLVHASASTAEPSAFLAKNIKSSKIIDDRKQILDDYLAKLSSPLQPYVSDIIDNADRNNIHWALVVSIAGVESTFCKSIPIDSFNCWGWNNGNHKFDSFKEGIEVVSHKLKLNYYDRGFNTIDKIGKIYAPPTLLWSSKVTYFMNQIDGSYITSPPKIKFPF